MQAVLSKSSYFIIFNCNKNKSSIGIGSSPVRDLEIYIYIYIYMFQIMKKRLQYRCAVMNSSEVLQGIFSPPVQEL